MAQKLRCTVDELIDHGDQVYSLALKPERKAPRFTAGQFLHLALDPYRPGDFWPESRVFSIASSPLDRERIQITYAVKGQFTGRMQAELQPGAQVWVKMPYGEFAVSMEREVCLIAGGTGITAFTAFLAALPDQHPQGVSVFYGARRPGLLIYLPLIKAKAACCPNLKAFYVVESETRQGDYLGGRLDTALVWEKLAAPLGVDYYLSGPPAMLAALKNQLISKGVREERVKIDAWE